LTVASVVNAGSVSIVCPECDAIVVVPVNCEIENPEGAWLGAAALNCTPDMTDLWAHMWTHEEADHG